MLARICIPNTEWSQVNLFRKRNTPAGIFYELCGISWKKNWLRFSRKGAASRLLSNFPRKPAFLPQPFTGWSNASRALP